MVTELTAAEHLDFLNGQLDRLIPDQLKQRARYPGQIETVQLPPFFLGPLDDEYAPSLRVAIVEKNALPNPTPWQEDDNPSAGSVHNWARVINQRRREAIDHHLLSEKDRLMVLLVAQESLPYGVHILDFIEAASLRQQGLGQAFFKGFNEVLKELGYRYWWGEHNPDNINFFTQKLGSYPLTQLQSIKLPNGSQLIAPEYLTDLNSVKFLDPQLEKVLVKPEFLKSPLK